MGLGTQVMQLVGTSIGFKLQVVRGGRVVTVLQVAALAPLDERQHAVKHAERAMQGILHEEEEPAVQT